MAGPLVIDRQAIAALCGKYAVRRLVLFGSAGTDRFDEATSDIDFLVEFDDAPVSRFDAYFGLKEDLEALFGRPVDLVSAAALENPYLAKSIASTGRELLRPEIPKLL